MKKANSILCSIFVASLVAIGLCFLSITAFAAAPAPVVTVDLYGNVFVDGANTNQQIGDFARNNPQLAPQVDGAVRDAALVARKLIADNAKSAQDSAASQVSAAEKAKEEAIAAHTVSKAAEIADLKKQIADLTKEIEELKRQLQASNAR